MPYATHWVCCKCGFGPMLICNYPSCLECGHRGAKASCCPHQALSNTRSSRYETVSPHRSMSHASIRESGSPGRYNSPTILPSSLPGSVGGSKARPYAPTQNPRTDLYYCCACGDGPKVYQHHARCVNCNHDACRYCKPVKR